MEPTLERAAVWIAYGKRCPYCGELIDFRELEIDHIIPAWLEENTEELGKVKTSLNLPSDFPLNSALNLLPAHALCNRRKRATIFNESSARFFLNMVESNLEKINTTKRELELKSAKDSLLNSLRIGLESGTINSSDLLSSLSDTSGVMSGVRLDFNDDGVDVELTPQSTEGMLDRPVLIGSSPSIDGIEFVNGRDETISVRTCREYRAAIEASFFARTTFALKMEGYFKVISAVLSVARSARVPQVSYIQNPRLGVSDLYLLPKDILPWIDPDFEEMLKSMRERTLQELALASEISILDVSTNSLRIGFADAGASIRELLRADIDGDGIEEILVEHYTFAIGGTFGASSIGMLKRTSSNSLFQYTDYEP